MEKDIECLEKVQKRLIRSLSNVRGSTYEEKLKDAGLTSLKDRRRRGDLIEAFKTLNGFNNVEKSAWFEIADPDQSHHVTRSQSSDVTNGNSTCILRQRARTELRNQSYRFRTARAWSCLPDNVRNATSVNAFKNAYDAWQTKSQTQ